MSTWTLIGDLSGAPGSAGTAGATGASGSAGSPGDPGSSGADGATGPAGARGAKIYTGAGLPSVVAPSAWTPDGTDAAVGDVYIDSSSNTYYILTV